MNRTKGKSVSLNCGCLSSSSFKMISVGVLRISVIDNEISMKVIFTVNIIVNISNTHVISVRLGLEREY